MPVTLVVQSGKHKGTKLVLSKPELIIGRDESCGLRLTAGGVSREHCRLTLESGGCFVSDMGSQNGTIVNGATIEGKVKLQLGDRLVVGPMEFAVAGVPSAADTADPARPPASDKAPAKAPAAGNSRQKPKSVASDDEIASWLSEGLGQDLGSSDSTIVMRAMPGAADSDSSSELSPVAQASAPSGGVMPESLDDDGESESSGRKFPSLAAEAADIIRRHFEMTGQQPPG
jgi:pSer/pThr/pTyr-binding forkhead associated (FHA) protein